MSGELERRASDAEREQVVVRLRDASAEGRLTLEELAGAPHRFSAGRRQRGRQVLGQRHELGVGARRVGEFGLIGEVKVVRS